MAAAAPFIVAGTSIVAAQQAKAVGKYNESNHSANL